MSHEAYDKLKAMPQFKKEVVNFLVRCGYDLEYAVNNLYEFRWTTMAIDDYIDDLLLDCFYDYFNEGDEVDYQEFTKYLVDHGIVLILNEVIITDRVVIEEALKFPC